MPGEASGKRSALWRGRREVGRTWSVAANEVVRLPVSARGSLRVLSGRVVVTSEGDPVDHVLEPGGELALAGRRRALAWALVPSRLELCVAAPAELAVPAPSPVAR